MSRLVCLNYISILYAAEPPVIRLTYSKYGRCGKHMGK